MTVDDLITRIRELYRIHPTGGPLHVELDDGNLDGTIRPYYDCFTVEELDALYHDGTPIAELDPEAPVVLEGLGSSTRQLCDEIAALMNEMSVEDRALARARALGYGTEP